MNQLPCAAAPSRLLPQYHVWTLLANSVTVMIVAILVVALCCRAATQSSPTLTIIDIGVVKVLILFSSKCVDRLEEKEYNKDKMLDKKKKHVRTHLSFFLSCSSCLIRLICLIHLIRSICLSCSSCSSSSTVVAIVVVEVLILFRPKYVDWVGEEEEEE